MRGETRLADEVDFSRAGPSCCRFHSEACRRRPHAPAGGRGFHLWPPGSADDWLCCLPGDVLQAALTLAAQLASALEGIDWARQRDLTHGAMAWEQRHPAPPLGLVCSCEGRTMACNNILPAAMARRSFKSTASVTTTLLAHVLCGMT